MGTGSGAWPIEVAQEYPLTRVFGVDLSLVESSLAPQNVEFLVMDITKGLKFEDNATDLVNSRYVNLVHALIKARWCWNPIETMAFLYQRGFADPKTGFRVGTIYRARVSFRVL